VTNVQLAVALERWALNRDRCNARRGSQQLDSDLLHQAAERLRDQVKALRACEAVLEWARTPGDHGGNPYCKRFVQLAGEAINPNTLETR